MDLTIVGNGVGGSSLARLARAAGHNVMLIGGQASASQAALAVVKASYLEAEADGTEAVRFALERYADAGCEIHMGAMVSSKSKPEAKLEGDWYAINPTPFLLKPDFHSAEIPAGWKDKETEVTIHATGAAGLEGKRSFGVTWYNADPRALTVDGLNVHRYAPYRSADAVRYRTGGCRLGSSSSASLAGARTAATRIFDEAQQRGWIGTTSGWLALVGVRVKRQAISEEVAPGVYAFGGFHRSGWSLAPLRAAQLLEKIVADRG